MHQSIFYRLGLFIYRFKGSLLALSLMCLLACLPFLSDIMSPFKSTGFIDETSESAITQQWLDKKLKFHHENQFIVLYHSKSLTTSNPLFHYKIKHSLLRLDEFPIEHDIIYPDMNPDQISKDKHSAFAVVTFHALQPLSSALLSDFKEAIQDPTHMSVYVGGEALFAEGVNKQTQEDLYKADMVAAPVAIIVLILVFGSLIAAAIPMCLGGCCALIILTLLFALGHLMTLSIFTLNIALLLGLCLNLDYALFIVARFRAELLLTPKDVKGALASTLATAGRAVFFSGLAVFISLSALLLFPINILFSIGVGGLTATFVAVVVATIVLPAVLAILQHRINCWPVRLMDDTGALGARRFYMRWKTAPWWGSVMLFFPMICAVTLLSVWQIFNSALKKIVLLISHDNKPHAWRTIAQHVVKHPFRYFLSCLVVLLMLGYPFLNVYFGIPDFKVLPKHTESRQFFDAYTRQFKSSELTPIMLVAKTKGDVLSPKAIGLLYDLGQKIEKNPRVFRVDSIVTGTPKLTKAQYQAYYRSPKVRENPLIETTTGDRFTVFNVISKHDVSATETKKLIRQLRSLEIPGVTLRMTGAPVIDLDVSDRVMEIFPKAALWIACLTYLILFSVLRSLFLPLKAIFMNILSLTASYGVIVFVFQEGHLHHFLHFSPQGMIDISLLIIVFCAIFGFSMDYEVFLLTRIQEAYLKTHDNNGSIVSGIEHSSRIITSAALIVMCLCGSFMVADVLMVKEFGLSIAVAIFVDAFLIRTFLVPSTMALVKSWNWYLPKWLDKILPKVNAPH